MKTKITEIKGSWQNIVDTCRLTVGKESLGHEPSTEFKKKILISEHSPIRKIIFEWKWDMPYWVAMHWAKHKWECAIRSQRTDRTGIDRRKLPQDAPVIFEGEANVQHLIDTMRKRLCYQAAPETREYAEDFKIALHEVEPEISDVLCPNCCYRGLCPEMKPCGFWDKFSKNLSKEDLIDWRKRYSAYNKYFLEKKVGEK